MRWWYALVLFLLVLLAPVMRSMIVRQLERQRLVSKLLALVLALMPAIAALELVHLASGQGDAIRRNLPLIGITYGVYYVATAFRRAKQRALVLLAVALAMNAGMAALIWQGELLRQVFTG